MTTPDTLPTWLADALDKPLVGPVALIALGCLFILMAAVLVDSWATYADRERQAAKDRHPAGTQITEFESAASHWHKPPVQAWANEPQEDKTA